MLFSPQFAGAWLTVCWRDSEHAKVAETFSTYMSACARETPEMRKFNALRWLYNNAIREEFYVLSAVTAARIPKRGMSPRLKALARDKMRCAYCGKINATTVDHVIPLSQGGALRDFLNVVAACEDCNQKKGGRTPEEAHMRLLWQPYWLDFPTYKDLNRRVLAPTPQKGNHSGTKYDLFSPQRAGDWLSVCWRGLNQYYLIADFVDHFSSLDMGNAPHRKRNVAVREWARRHGLKDALHAASLMESVTIRNGGLRLKSKVLARDKFRCAYCGKTNASTADHVIPVSRGGHRTTLLNVVAACAKCNHRKDNRTPEEAGMPLLWEPREIGFPVLF